jgi:hypothetical protein
MGTDHSNTDEFLAIRFPNVRPAWLRRLNKLLGIFKGVNGGNVEITTRYRAGIDQWVDWNGRDLSDDDKH